MPTSHLIECSNLNISHELNVYVFEYLLVHFGNKLYLLTYNTHIINQNPHQKGLNWRRRQADRRTDKVRTIASSLDRKMH